MLKLSLTFILYFIFKILHIKATAGTGTDFAINPRIKDGSLAELNSAKHQVCIRHRENESKYFGGGSLITSNVVLTAAHIFLNVKRNKYYSKNAFSVVMGDLDYFEENNNVLRFDISKIIRHSYNHANKNGDIALVILNGRVPDNHPTVQPIALNDGPLKNGIVCQVTGWGITEKNKYSRFLRSADVPIITINDCRDKTNYGYRIRNGMLCAGYLEGGPDACIADSGGPLVCRGVQAGIVSWGVGCGERLYPGVYTDVAYYKNWILHQLRHHNAYLPTFSPVLI